MKLQMTPCGLGSPEEKRTKVEVYSVTSNYISKGAYNNQNIMVQAEKHTKTNGTKRRVQK